MKFLLDAHLPVRLVMWFEERGHIAQCVAEVLNPAASDHSVAKYCYTHDYILVSKDSDFFLIQKIMPFRFVWLRSGNSSTRALESWLEPRWPPLLEALGRGDTFIELL